MYDKEIILTPTLGEVAAMACAVRRLSAAMATRLQTTAKGIARGETEKERRSNAFFWVGTEYEMLAASVEMVRSASELIADTMCVLAYGEDYE